MTTSDLGDTLPSFFRGTGPAMIKKPPILKTKYYDRSSVFKPENLIREGRRQMNKDTGPVPEVVLLDPDGDILKWLMDQERVELSSNWACYHTKLYQFTLQGLTVGIIAQAVGASFAVLLAEQLFVSGCKLLLSMTSSGKISPSLETPSIVLIDKALRDEGTSYHYLPPADYSVANPTFLAALTSAKWKSECAVHQGPVWTTDAPYRETAEAIAEARNRGLLAVEMEAAALYAFATATENPVICFAHITNQMAQDGMDFEKGQENGAKDALSILATAAQKLIPLI